MKRTAGVGLSVLFLLAAAACGSDDEPSKEISDETSGSAKASTPTDETTDTESTATDSASSSGSASSGELPSYEEVKALWRASTSDKDRASCDEGPEEDKDVYTVNDGDYIRYVCQDFERFDYVTGAENYADNFASESENLTGRAVFHIPGQAFVAPAGADPDLALAIKAACGCGEVLGPEY